MPKSMIFEGKTTNEAIEKGLKQFHTTKENVEIKVIEEEKRSFFNILEPRKVKVEITLKEEVKTDKKLKNNEVNKDNTNKEEINLEEIKQIRDEVERFVKELINTLPTKNIEYTVKCEDSYINIDINGQDINYLIGYRGETLNALQTLISSFVSIRTKSKIKVILDIGKYKEKRKNTLVNLAIKTANNVIRNGKQVTLEPMQAYERKIIHTALQNNNKVKTYSIGEEPYRKIVISPKFFKKRNS